MRLVCVNRFCTKSYEVLNLFSPSSLHIAFLSAWIDYSNQEKRGLTPSFMGLILPHAFDSEDVSFELAIERCWTNGMPRRFDVLTHSLV